MVVRCERCPEASRLCRAGGGQRRDAICALCQTPASAEGTWSIVHRAEPQQSEAAIAQARHRPYGAFFLRDLHCRVQTDQFLQILCLCPTGGLQLFLEPQIASTLRARRRTGEVRLLSQGDARPGNFSCVRGCGRFTSRATSSCSCSPCTARPGCVSPDDRDLGSPRRWLPPSV